EDAACAIGSDEGLADEPPDFLPVRSRFAGLLLDVEGGALDGLRCLRRVHLTCSRVRGGAIAALARGERRGRAGKEGGRELPAGVGGHEEPQDPGPAISGERAPWSRRRRSRASPRAGRTTAS